MTDGSWRLPAIARGAGGSADPAGVDEAALAAGLARGERAALNELIARHRDRVSRLAHRLLGWPDEVDDVVHDVFVAAMTHGKGFRGDSSLATWLTRITINACRLYRRRQALRRGLLDELRAWRKSSAAFPADRPAAQRDAFARVRQAVSELPAKYREVVVLRYMEEFPMARIADVLRLKVNTVEVRLSRARRMLEEALGNEFMQ